MTDKDTKKEETKELDILDEVKRMEKLTKAQLLRKTITKIKKYAKEVMKLKEQTTIALEEIGLGETDIKRVIDFVNSLDDVHLTESEKRELREESREEVSEQREEIQKEIDKKGLDIVQRLAYMPQQLGGGGGAYYAVNSNLGNAGSGGGGLNGWGGANAIHTASYMASLTSGTNGSSLNIKL